MAPRIKATRTVARSGKSNVNKKKSDHPKAENGEDSGTKTEREEQKEREEEEQRKREEEEAKRKRDEEEQRKREEEETKRKREEEETKRKREEEERTRVEEEAKRKREEEEQRKREEERRRAEGEAKRKREEEAKRKREEEAKRKREEEAKKKREIEEAKRQKEAEAEERRKKEDTEDTQRTSTPVQIQSRPRDLQHHPTTSEPLSDNSQRETLVNISYHVLSSLIPELKWISLDFFTRAVARYADQLPKTIAAAIQIFHPGAFAVRYFFDPNRTDHVAACFKTSANTTSSFIRQQNCWYSITRTGLTVKAPNPSDLPDLICVVYPA